MYTSLLFQVQYLAVAQDRIVFWYAGLQDSNVLSLRTPLHPFLFSLTVRSLFKFSRASSSQECCIITPQRDTRGGCAEFSSLVHCHTAHCPAGVLHTFMALQSFPAQKTPLCEGTSHLSSKRMRFWFDLFFLTMELYMHVMNQSSSWKRLNYLGIACAGSITNAATVSTCWFFSSCLWWMNSFHILTVTTATGNRVCFAAAMNEHAWCQQHWFLGTNSAWLRFQILTSHSKCQHI